MKTAIELANGKPSSIDDDLYAWATEAAAMLRQQAEQIEQLEVERLRLAGEVSNRNIRALEGDKSAAAFNTLYDEFETLRAALTASYTSELDELAVRNYSLRKENESLLKANLDCFDNFNTLKADYDALKADAERYKWLKQRLLCADFSYGEPSEGRNALVFEIPTDMRVSTDLDSSIDAMKGES